MFNAIPVFGWLIDFFIKASLAVPFWFIWTVLGLGKKYFFFLHPVYLNPSFWDCIGLFMTVPIIYLIFMPKLVSVSQTNNNNKEEEKEKEEKKTK